MRIAITGHRGLPDDTSRLVEDAIRAELASYPARYLVGISCLADGADQLFARAVLDHGGQLEVVVPATEYRDGLPQGARPSYDELLKRASDVYRLDRRVSDAEAHMNASALMLASAERLLAVWNGEPARAFGGTADVVALAEQRGIDVTVIWPTGARRGY